MVIDTVTSFPLEIKTSRGNYKTSIYVALEWFKTADGNMVATDYTSAADKYQAVITTYGTESYINGVINKLNIITKAGKYLYLYDFATDEKIFGEHVNYDGIFISALYIGYNRRTKTSFNGYGLDIGLKLSKPTFIDYGTFSFSGSAAVKYDYDADRDINVNNFDTYTGEDFTYNKIADSGSITYTMNLNSTQMIQLRNYQRTNRASTFTLTSIPGITYPFGPRSTGPWNVKLIDIEEKRFGLNRFEATVTLQEVI